MTNAQRNLVAAVLVLMGILLVLQLLHFGPHYITIGSNSSWLPVVYVWVWTGDGYDDDFVISNAPGFSAIVSFIGGVIAPIGLLGLAGFIVLGRRKGGN